MTQARLATLSGIPRNQIVRAEKGDNITLDTLRKIVIHLPLEHLTLLEKLKLDFDVLPQAEKMYLAAMETVSRSLTALATALETAKHARHALMSARRADPLPPEATDNVDNLFLIRSIEGTVEKVSNLLKEGRIA